MALIETALFPSAIVSEADLLNLANVTPSGSVASLAVDIAAGDTTLTLSADPGSQMPTSDFTVSIDDEIIFVGSRSGVTLSSLQRGYESTTAAAHTTGATVGHRITAKTHNQVVSEIVAMQSALGTNLSNVVGTSYFSNSAVTAPTNSINTETLMTWAMPTNYMDVLGRAIRITASGVISTSGTAPDLTMFVQLHNTVTLITGQQMTMVAGLASVGWILDCTIVRTATGTSGAVDTFGAFMVDTGTVGGAKLEMFSRTSALSSVDATGDKTLKIAAKFSSASASNSITQRFFQVQRLN